MKAGYIYGDFDLIKDIFMMLEIGIPVIYGVMLVRGKPPANPALRAPESPGDPLTAYGIN